MLHASRSIALLLLCCFLAGEGTAGFVPLREAVEPTLQRELEKTLRELGLERAARRKRLAVALVGITDTECPRFAAVNGDLMMYAASLPKIAILLGAFRRAQEGTLELDDEALELLTSMIRKSSNPAATTMMNRVGREYIAEMLQSPELRLYDPEFNGGLWVGKEYSKQPAWRRDPLHNLSHGATAFQVARFYYLLETGRLVRPDLAASMKEILSEPAIEHKFVAGLQRRVPGASLLRKSGTWRYYHADSALIEHDGRRYIAVAMAESQEGEAWLRQLIVALDELIFRVPPPRCPTAARPTGAEPAAADPGAPPPRAEAEEAAAGAGAASR